MIHIPNGLQLDSGFGGAGPHIGAQLSRNVPSAEQLLFILGFRSAWLARALHLTKQF